MSDSRIFKKQLKKYKGLFEWYAAEYPEEYIVKLTKKRPLDILKVKRQLRYSPFLILNSSKYIILYYVGTKDLKNIKTYLNISTNCITNIKKLKSTLNDYTYSLLERLVSI